MGAHRPVSVTGGSDGIAADCAEIREMGGRFGAAATETLAAATALHGLLGHPAVLLSALLDPIGFAEFEAVLLAALDGWQGLTWAGFECAGIDAELRLAATAYETADRFAVATRDVTAGALGAAPALAAGALVLARTGDPVRAAEALVAADPQLADLLVNVLGLPTLLLATARLLPDGHGVVRGPGIDRGGVAGVPPRDLPGVLADLARRDRDPRHGVIDVRVLTLADGSRRAIVDITGTKSWDPLPTRDVTSATTNGRALVGERTAYEDGVLRAMRAAGIRRRDPVLIVGHSQGGMVAVTAARDAVRSGEFDVTHVITAGAPVGLTAGSLPRQVQLLALEGRRDVVPHLDGTANPDLPNVTTAVGSRGDGSILGDHAMGTTYVPLGADAAASDSASIQHFLAGAQGYFQAASVETHTYQIERRY